MERNTLQPNVTGNKVAHRIMQGFCFQLPIIKLENFMSTSKELLQQNKRWSAQIKNKNPSFFKQLSKKKTPEFLWISCSDSRVPAEIVVNAEPGDMFIHRNISNQVYPY